MASPLIGCCRPSPTIGICDNRKGTHNGIHNPSNRVQHPVCRKPIPQSFTNALSKLMATKYHTLSGFTRNAR